jgi:MFS family permease
VTVEQHFARMLRWYPCAWRDRYGDEMTALLEDTYAESRVPFRDRISMAKSGTMERARVAGVLGDATGPGERIRGGSLLILGAWSLFMVAGPIFGKFTDNWVPATPKGDRWLPNDGLAAVEWAGLLGVALVLGSALFVAPTFIRLLRSGGWPSVRGSIVRAVMAGALAILMTLGVGVLAHQLSSRDRNGGWWPYGVAFFLWVALGVAAIAIGTGAAIAVGRRLELSLKSLRVLGWVALSLSAMMAVMIAGMVTWWAALATSAPRALSNGIGNGLFFNSNALPPTLVVAGFLMALGGVLASIGSLRVARTLRGGAAH